MSTTEPPLDHGSDRQPTRTPAREPENGSFTFGRAVAWAAIWSSCCRHAVPVLLDAAHRAVQRHSRWPPNPSSLLPADFTRAPSSGCSGCPPSRRRRRRAGPVPRSTSGCTCGTRSSSPRSSRSARSFFSAMAAYAFARLRWPGRDMVFGCSWPR